MKLKNLFYHNDMRYLRAQAEANHMNGVDWKNIVVNDVIYELRGAIWDGLDISNGRQVARIFRKRLIINGHDVEFISFEKSWSDVRVGGVVMIARIAVD